MPDFDQLDQIVMLSKALWFLPPPARATIAQGLYDIGLRVHPELATKVVMLQGAPGLGNHRPGKLVKIESRREAENVIKNMMPELWDKLQTASTQAQKQQLLREIRERHPQLITEAEAKLAAAKPEDFE